MVKPIRQTAGSAYKDDRGFVICWVPVGGDWKAKRRERVSEADTTGETDAQRLQGLTALARERNRYCRLIDDMEGKKIFSQERREAVTHAICIGAVTNAEATALLVGVPSAPTAPVNESVQMDLLTAYDRQSALGRAKAKDVKRHRDGLERFIAWSGKTTLVSVTREDVQMFVRYLRDEKDFSKDGIRHIVEGVRTACRYAPNLQLQDVLAGQNFLSGLPVKRPVRAYQMEDVLRVAAAPTTEPLMRVAIGFGVLMGLRLYETIRIQWENIDRDGILTISERKKKLNGSRLVIPPILRDWLEAIPPFENGQGSLFDYTGPHAEESFSQRLGRLLKANKLELPPKCLRKTFATWAYLEGLDGISIEYYQGHEHSIDDASESGVPLTAMTRSHYVDQGQILDRQIKDRYQPFAEEVSRRAKSILEDVTPKGAAPCPESN